MTKRKKKVRRGVLALAVRGILRALDFERDSEPPPVRRRRKPVRANATIHRVRQTRKTSCGVAVVAMAARVPEATAMRLMFPVGGRKYYTHYADLIRALDHFGVRHGGMPVRARLWTRVPATAVAKVRMRDGAGRVYVHWVIADRMADGRVVIVDPDAPGDTLATTDTDEYELLSYLLIDAVRPHRVARPARRKSRQSS